MTGDKLSGPKVRITVCKFLPAVFLDAMIDSPSISVQMLESEHEHPELIWNEKTRDRVSQTIRKIADNFYHNQKQNPEYQWKDPDMLSDIATSELVVSGFIFDFMQQIPAGLYVDHVNSYPTCSISSSRTQTAREHRRRS